jgi:RecA/RadA recombinase
VDYGSTLDAVERKFKLTVNMADRFKHSVSTGLLVDDLILGGGFLAGSMYTIAGAESSAKSTKMMNILASTLSLESTAQPNFILYGDAEGSLDPRYFRQMLKTKTTDQEIFGVKNNQGKWVVPARVRYYPENSGERVLDALNAMLRRIPDKEYIDNQWFYVFENTRDNQKLTSGKYSKTLFSRYNKFYVPTEDTGPQGIIVIDSWPALIPERVDDEDAGSGLGANARMFSEYLPKVKGKLRRKAVTLIGANQLRERPMAKGDPRYEPGGNTLKFNADVRLWHTPRAIPHGTGQFEKEASVFGKGEDIYRYLHGKTIKNKLSTPYLEGWYRLWVTDANGQGHGFCPVWDVFQYLKMTRQCSGTMRKLTIPMVRKAPLTWLEFKGLILLKGVALQKHCKSLKLAKNPRLREKCFSQIRSGEGSRLFFEGIREGSADYDEE